jgi:surface polysaccharide O-acyltransferase-like enzyme
VAGALVGLHFDVVTAWVRDHRAAVARIAAAGVVFGVTAYLFNVYVDGATPLHASEVFQPAVTVESITAIVGLYALGLWLIERMPTRRLRLLERSSDISFGVYLAHPLVLGLLWSGALALGAGNVFRSLPGPVGVTLVLTMLVPLTYLVTASIVAVARRTPLSLALTGRARQTLSRPAVPAVPAVVAMTTAPLAVAPAPVLDPVAVR